MDFKFFFSDVDIEGFIDNTPREALTQFQKSALKPETIFGTFRIKPSLSLTPKATQGESNKKSA